MSNKENPTCGKHLSAKELLQNKGICCKAWNEWEESSRTLPKSGSAKQFEPNGSWLESKQMEKGLASREFLLGMERVQRQGRLASAEWSAEDGKARVTKKSGAEWANFGHEVNSNLYLSPEEALILVEMESLELLWQGIPMSIQQAYEILLQSDCSECSLDEYRVYSQLTRLGYRLQRFHYEKKFPRAASDDQQPGQRKKIVNPKNGLWMASNNAESSKSPESLTSEDVKEITENVTSEGKSKNAEDTSVKTTKIIESPERKSQLERKTKNSKLEIISEQTLLPPIKILVNKEGSSEQVVSKWPGARIQRNVKLLPKRNDKISTCIGRTESPANSKSAKRKLTRVVHVDPQETKKSKHEVIDLSDDDIEETPRPMSRMEMLNCLPNIAGQIFITQTISKAYIPQGVQAQSTYRYDTRKLLNMRDTDDEARRKSNSESHRNGTSRNSNDRNNQIVVSYNNHQGNHGNQAGNNCFQPKFTHNYNRSFTNDFRQSASMRGNQDFYSQQPSTYQRSNWQTSQNRWAYNQMNFLRFSSMPMTWRSPAHNHGFSQSNFQRNCPSISTQQFYNRSHRHLDLERSTAHRSSQSRENSQNRSEDLRQRSSVDGFDGRPCLKYPEAISWQELKRKLREAKTITIDDEDKNDDASDEIQVVDQTVNPLICSKKIGTISEIYERLRIIKPAPDKKSVRRKRSDLKISYNVFSSTQHYRKSNPGLPMFHLVVTRRRDDVFLQPVELNRLQQDGKGAPIMFAHVSHSTIAYIQSGIVNLPNLI